MCDFPARQLAEEAMKVMARVWEEPAKYTYAAGFLKSAGELALFHEDLTGCQCWRRTMIKMGLVNGAGGGTEEISGRVHGDIDELWKQAGNKVQRHKPEEGRYEP